MNPRCFSCPASSKTAMPHLVELSKYSLDEILTCALVSHRDSILNYSIMNFFKHVPLSLRAFSGLRWNLTGVKVVHVVQVSIFLNFPNKKGYF